MNIKRALGARDAPLSISIYAQVRKQPRICRRRRRRREIDSPQKQADSLERVERFPLLSTPSLVLSFSRAREREGGALSELFKSS